MKNRQITEMLRWDKLTHMVSHKKPQLTLTSVVICGLVMIFERNGCENF
jgi:hypothetical protein